jgi:hypothetical protein
MEIMLHDNRTGGTSSKLSRRLGDMCGEVLGSHKEWVSSVKE